MQQQRQVQESSWESECTKKEKERVETVNMKDWKGIIALAVVTVLAVVLIWGTTALTGRGDRQEAKETEGMTAAAGKTEELAVEGYEGIRKAVRNISGDGQVEGYEVTVSTEGYQGPILMTAYLDGSGTKLNRLEMLEQQETENLGGKIAEPDFLKQFQDIALPVSLARPGEKSGSEGQQARLSAAGTVKSTDGMESVKATDEVNSAKETNGTKSGTQTDGAKSIRQTDGTSGSGTGTVREGETLPEWTGLRDGTYEARAEEYNSGFLDFVVMTVSRGRVTALTWDAVDEDGNSKRILADKGEYVMTEDGLSWSEQADALAEEILRRQSLEFLAPDTAGKIDGIAGVSISVTPFIDLVRKCLIQAGAVSVENPGNLSSQESGAGEGTNSERETGTAFGGDKDSEQSPEGESGIEPISDYPPENEADGKSQIDGISGATISSAAVVQGVNQAYEYVQDASGSAAR